MLSKRHQIPVLFLSSPFHSHNLLFWEGNVVATQFHPEKSGQAGLDFIRAFLERSATSTALTEVPILKRDA